MEDTQKNRDGPSLNNSDDAQLTIKIPNPKVYMARQSLWVGRRGKPRCDHCRLHNLKCDRVLPTCNHCLWATGRVCKYTPLPTPAHRGIPRCDRCRSQNSKCDRNLPVCNYCKEDNRTECIYTPKKRRKTASETTSILLQGDGNEPSELPAAPPEHAGDKDIANRSTAAPSLMREDNSSSRSHSPDESKVQEPHTNQITVESHQASSSPPAFLQQPPDVDDFQPYPIQMTIPTSSPVSPWTHHGIAPLPEFIIRGLESVNSAEMPNSTTFNESLTRFLDDTMDELRETSCLALDTYTAVSRCLSRGDTSLLSSRLREWVALHHLCSGSDRFSLILMPREPMFQSDQASREPYRKAYRARVDGNLPEEGSNTTNQLGSAPETDYFERIPVREQIFDILTYAHASHGDSFVMLHSIRKWGFAFVTWPMAELYSRLCPVCNFRNRQAESLPNP